MFSLDSLKLVLDIAGFVCPAADLVNAAIGLARGDYAGAGLDLIGALPLFGDAIKAGRMAKTGNKAIEAMEFTYKVTGKLDTLSDGLKGTLNALDNAYDVSKGATRGLANASDIIKGDDDIGDVGKLIDHLSNGVNAGGNASDAVKSIDNYTSGGKIINKIEEVKV